MPEDAPLWYLYVNGPKPPPVVVVDRRIQRVCAWLVAFYLTGIKPDKVDKTGSDMTDPVPELAQLLRATDKAPSDAEMRREAAAELTRLAQEMGLIP